MSTDAHVVSPLFFPGGDIGCLSINGTINDVAVMGATPLYLAAGFILEEGLPLADLARIVESMARAATAAGVPVVTGDTKVVQRGRGDGVYITTTGVGVVADGEDFSGDRARPATDHRLRRHWRARHGDHGAAREHRLRRDIVSDTAALHGLIAAMRASGAAITSCATRRAAAWRRR
jgi:hydrogenase expression/formation protein HypE